MRLYHTTASIHLDSIKEHGLLPRRNRRGNWWTNVSSHPAMVYLSDTPRQHFYGFKACIATQTDRYVVFSVDGDFLYESLFRPDENYIDFKESGTNLNTPFHTRYAQIERAYYQAHLWQECIEKCGLVGYAGVIPFEELTIEHEAPVQENPFYREDLFYLDVDLDTKMVQTDLLLQEHLIAQYYGIEERSWHKSIIPIPMRENFVMEAVELGRQNTHVYIETTA